MRTRGPNARGRARRAVGLGLAATLAVFAGAVPSTAASALAGSAGESFAEDTVKMAGWRKLSPRGEHRPCLTAAPDSEEGALPGCKGGPFDEAGQGAFQLTSNAKEEAGALVLDRKINTSRGLRVQFDQYQYDARERGADGISFFFVKGDTDIQNVGDVGAGIGYKDLEGAVAGVLLDQFGNASDPRKWHSGDKGPGQSPDHVVLRGGEDAKYQYVDGKKAPAPLGADKAKSRDEARRTVVIDINPENVMTVSIDDQPVMEEVDLNDLPGQEALPKRVKLGFAASTGRWGSVHEINNFKISQLDPDLTASLEAPEELSRTEPNPIVIEVENKKDAGPTTGPVTVKLASPEGVTVTEPSGDGWECTTENGLECTRDDPLKPGEKFPPIQASLDVADDAPDTVELKGTVETENEGDPEDNTIEPRQIPVGDGPYENGTGDGDDENGEGDPGLTMNTYADREVVAGSSTRYIAELEPTNGPVGKKVTATFKPRHGATIRKIDRDGWECEIAEDKSEATCTGTGDDGKYSDIEMRVRIPSDASGKDMAVDGEVRTEDGAAPADAEVEQVRAETRLSVGITSSPKPYQPGDVLSYYVDVVNRGQSDANGAPLRIDFPPYMDGVNWKCKSDKGPGCPEGVDAEGGGIIGGQGDIDLRVDVPAGARLSFVIECILPGNAAGLVVAEAQLEAPAYATDRRCDPKCKPERDENNP